MKGGRRQGRQRKRWEDNIREWTGLEFGKFQRAVENREKWRKLVAKSSVVSPTTLTVKGLMMMIMMHAVIHIDAMLPATPAAALQLRGFQ